MTWQLISDIFPTEGDICMVLVVPPNGGTVPAPIDPETGLPDPDAPEIPVTEVQVCYYTNNMFIGYFGNTFSILTDVLAFKPIVFPTTEELDALMAQIYGTAP